MPARRSRSRSTASPLRWRKRERFFSFSRFIPFTEDLTCPSGARWWNGLPWPASLEAGNGRYHTQYRAKPGRGAVILKIIRRRILNINWRSPRPDQPRHPVWPLTAAMPVRLPSDNHVVRVAIGRPGFPDISDLTARTSFGRLPMPQCQAVTAQLRLGCRRSVLVTRPSRAAFATASVTPDKCSKSTAN